MVELVKDGVPRQAERKSARRRLECQGPKMVANMVTKPSWEVGRQSGWVELVRRPFPRQQMLECLCGFLGLQGRRLERRRRMDVCCSDGLVDHDLSCGDIDSSEDKVSGEGLGWLMGGDARILRKGCGFGCWLQNSFFEWSLRKPIVFDYEERVFINLEAASLKAPCRRRGIVEGADRKRHSGLWWVGTTPRSSGLGVLSRRRKKALEFRVHY